jgi:uncharacterized protein YjbJ (UPF0337 family)
MASPTTQKWSGDDFTRAEGKYDELVGIINERTGESREKIKQLLEDNI